MGGTPRSVRSAAPTEAKGADPTDTSTEADSKSSLERRKLGLVSAEDAVRCRRLHREDHCEGPHHAARARQVGTDAASPDRSVAPVEDKGADPSGSSPCAATWDRLERRNPSQ